ncbi:Tfp pilus assembly protein FimV [Microbacterium endophyticum]|uniref:Tfp pilus assembly protein FimV n=1 Tax=Microbacterium endophyticum TaxID=1526412 RepID=A0A7W4YNV1_9MICO|nr:LysM peptidoglycan-binding domain-containing protein [Microbacterium endophyticum]MBB2976076.1 Tfp pilus assembly protein FimV [Microbacterium endophyticum]NIK35006.1 Tfp pilus assembly protein FimV [Microbacterium endophyticum]
MTTISASPFLSTAPATRHTATRLRMTQRGRRVLLSVAATPIAVALAFALLSGGSALASRDNGAAIGTFETITVATGDTLWAIAEEIAPAADPRDVVDALIRFNSLDGAVVAAGQTLAIPSEYSAAQ